MADVLAAFGRSARGAIDTASGARDQDTADIFTEISRGTDKWLWMVEAHAQTGEWAHRSANPERETERQPRH